MSTYEKGDRVVLAQRQLHGNTAVLSDAEFISAQGEHATVVVDGEDVTKQVPLDTLQLATEVYGAGYGPNDVQVINALRS